MGQKNILSSGEKSFYREVGGGGVGEVFLEVV